MASRLQCLLVIGFVASGCADRRDGDQGRGDGAMPERPGRNVLMTSATGSFVLEPFSRMVWNDIRPTAEAAAAEGVGERLQKQLEAVNHPPACYLSGLLLLSLGKPAEALSQWASLNPEEIPGDHLYAPWRLSAAVNPPPAANPFQQALTEAVSRRAVSPLIEARVHVRNGQYAQGMEVYLKTDPMQWANEDVVLVQQLRRYAPTSHDALRLVAATLKGGRLSERLHKPMQALLSNPEDFPSQDVLAGLKERLVTDAGFREAVLSATAEQLTLRQAFASSDFGRVLELGSTSSPETAANETVLLMFVAAAKTGQTCIRDRWALELRRRFPDSAIQQWIQTLTGSQDEP